MSLPFKYLGRRRPMDERLPDGRTVDESLAEQSSQDSPFSRALSSLVRREPESPDRVMSGGVPSPLLPRRDAVTSQPSGWQDRLPEISSGGLEKGRGGLGANVIEAALRGGMQSYEPLPKRRPQDDSESAPAGGLGTIRPPYPPTLKPRDVSVTSVPVSDSLVRALERRSSVASDSKPLTEMSPMELAVFQRGSGNDAARGMAPTLQPRALVRDEAPSRAEFPAPALSSARRNAILSDRSLPPGVDSPVSSPSRRPRVEEIGRPPEFGFDLKGKPVRAWRNDDLTTDLEYRRRLQDYKPKDRNGKLRSILYGIAWAISQGAKDGNPWSVLGSAITGGLIGGIHPQFDEEHAREYEMAAADSRIDKGLKRRREQLEFERGVADRDKTLQEIQKMKDEPARLQREAQLKSTDEMRRVLAGFYNNLPEFDPEIDKDLAAALREAGLPVTAKRGAQENKVVQDEKTGAWHVVTTNKRTGETISRPVKKENGVQLVTTPKGTLRAEENAANRASRERIESQRESGRNRRATDKGSSVGMTPAQRRSLQLKAENLDAQANASDAKGRSIDATKYRQQAAAVRRQLEGAQASGQGGKATYTVDEVRARARRDGRDENAAVEAARAAGLLRQ